MNPLYNFGIWAYKTAVRIASVRNRKARAMLNGQQETLDILSKLPAASERIWVHAASLGEFEQGRPLIELIKRDRPQAQVILSFFSPSGYEVRKNYPLADAVVYLPFDLPRNVTRFLDAAKPTMAIFIKYEFWGNYLSELKRRGIATYIISAIFRDSQMFFKSWGGEFRKMLTCFNTIFVQDENSRELLHGIGVDNVMVTGDTRFDRVAAVRDNARSIEVVEQMLDGGPLTIVAGSSWEPDEDLLIPYFNTHPNVTLIIAPHEFDRERLGQMLSRIKRPAGLYSMTSVADAAHLDCLIIDTFGLLSSLYRYGDIAYVGGGFGTGIHNINEAAVYGIPVVFGPRYQKFREAVDLVEAGGAITVSDQASFNAALDTLTTDAAARRERGTIARDYIQSHLGATQAVYSHIFPAEE